MLCYFPAESRRQLKTISQSAGENELLLGKLLLVQGARLEKWIALFAESPADLILFMCKIWNSGLSGSNYEMRFGS